LCPCGQQHKSSEILPEDYGFPEAYCTKEEYKKITLDNLIVNTYRLRTGYIEEEYINVSAKREGAGEAYIEYYFSKKVRSFEINLSYWQIKDVLSNLNSEAVLEVYRNNNWIFVEDLIAANLSTDRTKQDAFTYSYIGQEINGLRIKSTAPAIGSRNLGRISIGNLTLIHQI